MVVVWCRRLEERIQMLTSQMIKGDRSTSTHYATSGTTHYTFKPTRGIESLRTFGKQCSS